MLSRIQKSCSIERQWEEKRNLLCFTTVIKYSFWIFQQFSFGDCWWLFKLISGTVNFISSYLTIKKYIKVIVTSVGGKKSMLNYINFCIKTSLYMNVIHCSVTVYLHILLPPVFSLVWEHFLTKLCGHALYHVLCKWGHQIYDPLLLMRCIDHYQKYFN